MLTLDSDLTVFLLIFFNSVYFNTLSKNNFINHFVKTSLKPRTWVTLQVYFGNFYNKVNSLHYWQLGISLCVGGIHVLNSMSVLYYSAWLDSVTDSIYVLQIAAGRTNYDYCYFLWNSSKAEEGILAGGVWMLNREAGKAAQELCHNGLTGCLQHRVSQKIQIYVSWKCSGVPSVWESVYLLHI